MTDDLRVGFGRANVSIQGTMGLRQLGFCRINEGLIENCLQTGVLLQQHLFRSRNQRRRNVIRGKSAQKTHHVPSTPTLTPRGHSRLRSQIYVLSRFRDWPSSLLCPPGFGVSGTPHANVNSNNRNARAHSKITIIIKISAPTGSLMANGGEKMYSQWQLVS